jgi:hypothetical protein
MEIKGADKRHKQRRKHCMPFFTFIHVYSQLYSFDLQNIVHAIVENVCLFMFFHALLRCKFNWRNIFSFAIIITLINQLLFLMHAVQLIHIIAGIVIWTVVVVMVLKRNAVYALFTVVLSFVVMFLTSYYLAVKVLSGLHLGMSPWYLVQMRWYSDAAVLLILTLLLSLVFSRGHNQLTKPGKLPAGRHIG